MRSVQLAETERNCYKAKVAVRMKSMRLLLALTLALMLPRTAGTAQKRVERIDLCEILKNAHDYDGKEVSVRATYSYFFEISELYCLNCRDKGRVWLDFSDEMDSDSKNALRSIPEGIGIVNMTLTGVFETGQAYGDGGYRHRLVARKIWDVVVLVRGAKRSEKEKKVVAECACGGTNPK